VRLLTASGAVIDQPIRTTGDRLTALFWGRPHARILIETSTEVAQDLEALVGHEVIVADSNYGLMYGHRSRRMKADRRDVPALAEACRHGASDREDCGRIFDRSGPISAAKSASGGPATPRS
jgi:hypothetical protein